MDDRIENYRPSMSGEVLRSWAEDAQATIERLTARVTELERERNLILAALPDDYTESKDWAFDKAPVLRIEWLKSRIDNLKQERSLQDEQLDALRKQEAEVESASQNWAGMDGAVAWHIIDRHSTGWADVGAMMDAWLKANTQAPLVPIPTTAEPVAYVTDSGRSAVMVAGANLDDDTPLYTQAPPAAAVPEGWKLVPPEPTYEMSKAFVDNCVGTSKGGIIVRKGAYPAMLAAAPAPEEGE